MKGPLRFALMAIALVIFILLILPFVINVNQFRPTVESDLSAALGRPVQVADLRLSILSGSLGADNLSIADDPSFSKSAFLSAKSLKVGIELLPLIFSRSLHVTRITIENPEVTLLKNPEGRWNFSSLGSHGTTSSASGTQPAANAPAESSGGGAPNFVIESLELKDGRMTVGSTSSSKRSVYDNVNVTASDVALTSHSPVKFSAKLPGGGNATLDGKVGPLDATDAALSPVDAKLAVTSLNLAQTGFVDPNSGLGGLVDIEANVGSKGGEAQVQGTVKMNKMQLVKNSSPAGTTIEVDFATNYDLRKSGGVLNPSTVKIGAAAAHLSGTYDLKGEAPVLALKIDGQQMPVTDLEAILPAVGVILPKGSSLKSGTLGTNLNVAGPTDKLVTTGNINLANATLAGFDAGSKMSALSSFAGVRKSPDTTIEKLTSDLRVSPEGIQLTNLDTVVSGIGEITGNGTVGADSSLDFKMRAVLSSGVGGVLSAKGGGKNAGIPFSIQGTTSDPKFIPDVGGIMKSEAGAALNETGASKLSGAVGGLLGKEKSNQ